MDTQILQELEIAAQIILAPSNIVNNAQRQAAESVFVNLKKKKSPYVLCKYILENSKMDYVLFEIAAVLKDVIIREWTFTPQSDIFSLRQYLLQYVTERCNYLPVFVREKILQVITIIVKRGSVDDNAAYRGHLLNEVEQLIMLGDHGKKMVGCSLLSALIQEYSITDKSSNLGLTWKLNITAKEQFEATDLKKIFQFCVKVLHNLTHADLPFSEESVPLVKQFLAITETILCWEFKNPYFCKTPFLKCIYEVKENPILRLTTAWKDVILDSQIVNLFFTLYWKIRSNPQLSHHAFTCLIQLATLEGTIFDSDNCHFQYLKNYTEGFVKFLTNVEILDREALGLSKIICNLLYQYSAPFSKDQKDSVWDSEFIQSFMKHLVSLTCHFAEGAAQEEIICDDDRLYTEAFDNMMVAWTNLLPFASNWKIKYLDALMQIFEIYLKCHLAPPLGTRGEQKNEQEELHETNEIDRIKFKDQLLHIGEFGRICPAHCLPLMSQLIEEKTKQLNNHFGKLQSRKSATNSHSNSHSTLMFGNMHCGKLDSQQFLSLSDSNSLLLLFEDLHWLLLIACNIISVDPTCDSSHLPDELKTYFESHSSEYDVEIERQVFGSLGRNFDEFAGAETKVDPVIRLLSSILRLNYLFEKFIQAKILEFLSPEVVSSMLWFLSQWAKVYILENSDDFTSSEYKSSHLFCTLRRYSEETIWAVNYLLEQAVNYLVHFNSEPEVAKDAVNLFNTIVCNQKRAECISKWDNLIKIVMVMPPLPYGIKRDVVKGLCLASLVLQDKNSRIEYLKQLLEPFQKKLLAILSQENFTRLSHEENVKTEILEILDCMIGASKVSNEHITVLVAQYLIPMISELPTLMMVFHNYQNIVELILNLMCTTVTKALPYLPCSNREKLYESFLKSIQTYVKSHWGKLTVESHWRDDIFTDLLLLLKLLTAFLENDCLEIPELKENQKSLTSADVCISGFCLIMPLITVDFLKYPPLCLQYFTLISFLAELCADKIFKLSENLIKTIFSTVELGLSSFGQEVIPKCCDFIRHLVRHIHSKSLEGETPPEAPKPFLRLLMDLVLTHRISEDFLVGASSAIYTMICCYQGEYGIFVETVLATQTDPSMKEKLSNAFNDLLKNISLQGDKLSERKFYDNFENFVINMYGIFT